MVSLAVWRNCQCKDQEMSAWSMVLFLCSVDCRQDLELRRGLFGKDLYLNVFIQPPDFCLFIFQEVV